CFETLDAFYIRFFPKIIAVSPEVQQLMRRYLISDKKMQVITNGIDMHEFRKDKSIRKKIRQELGIGLGILLIGSFGRISPEKGQKYFIAAAAQVLKKIPDARFLILGDGFQGDEMKAYAASIGIADSMTFLGFRKNIAEFYSALDLFVLPSLLEGTPMALLEAMSTELPVVATRVGGVGRIIRDGENGVLVSSANIEELARAMTQLLQNPVEAKKMAEDALQTIAERYSSQKMTDACMDLYTELVTPQPSDSHV
ncbi:MAG: glycosyltransferase family 1 protein, partial [Candidatus Electrothrix sp. AR3]|nr:glycosyltransferase family 1 protein [Candidatus Electrothrix sp. AR3]